jgi:zinc finger protein 830
MSKLPSKRIESPLAKYNSIGQLTCLVCNQVVKSENFWNAHLNSKTHLENKNKLKSQLTKSNAPPASSLSAVDNVQKNVFKRPASAVQNEVKSANSAQNFVNSKLEPDIESNTVVKKQKLDNLVDKKSNISQSKSEPSPVKMDTTENKESTPALTANVLTEQNEASNIPLNPLLEAAPSTALPEGFFDDPDMDDKVRGVSRADNLEAEYEEFKKIMQSEEHKSDKIVEQDDLLRDVDRDLEEVDELINRWSKIEDLHNKREALLANNKKKLDENKMRENAEDSDSSDVDLNEILNLEIRKKQF